MAQVKRKTRNEALAAEADKLADDLSHGHYSTSTAISMLRRCAVALARKP